MFNRNNLPNPFGSRPDGAPRIPSGGAPGGYGRPGEPQQAQRSTGYGAYDEFPKGYGDNMEKVPSRALVGRQAPARSGGSGKALFLRPAKSPDNSYTFQNR